MGTFLKSFDTGACRSEMPAGERTTEAGFEVVCEGGGFVP